MKSNQYSRRCVHVASNIFPLCVKLSNDSKYGVTEVLHNVLIFKGSFIGAGGAVADTNHFLLIMQVLFRAVH